MPRARLGDVALNYELTGEGTPVVLIHGLGNDLHLWDEVVPFLEPHHQVLRFDVRGFGLSDKPPGPYSIELFAADLAHLLDCLSIERAHISGLSMGGVIAQRFALDYPVRVRSLLLASTSSEVGEKSAAAWLRLADLIEKRGFNPRRADASRAFSSEFGKRRPDVVQEAALRNAKNDPASYAAAARASGMYGWTERLSEIDRPVLLVQGLEDRLTPPGGSVKMHRQLRRSRLLMLENTGHNVQAEHPQRFAYAALGFMAGIDLEEAARTS